MVNVLKEEKYKNLRIDFRKNPNVPNMIVAYIEGIDDVLVNPVVASTKDEAFNIAKDIIDNYKGKINKIVPLKNIQIVWAECSVSKTKFKSWKEFQEVVDKCYKESSDVTDGTYDKIKIKITWEDGVYLIDRIDVGNNKNDYHKQKSVGEYLKNEEPFYESKIPQGQRSNYQWG